MPKIQFLEEKVGYDKAENYDERGPQYYYLLSGQTILKKLPTEKLEIEIWGFQENLPKFQIFLEEFWRLQNF